MQLMSKKESSLEFFNKTNKETHIQLRSKSYNYMFSSTRLAMRFTDATKQELSHIEEVLKTKR